MGGTYHIFYNHVLDVLPDVFHEDSLLASWISGCQADLPKTDFECKVEVQPRK